MIFELKDWTISTHLLPALVNGDYSGLADDEVHILDNWLDYATEGWTDANEQEWVYAHEAVLDGTEDEFGRCEITNMRGSVQIVRLHFVAKR